MTRDEAAVCFARLVAHWPKLGGDEGDPEATSRAVDWIEALSRLHADTGMAAISEVIEQHREVRLPRFADVQDAARRAAIQKRAQTEYRELEAGPDQPGSRERVRALCERMSALLANVDRHPTAEHPVKVSRYDRPASPRILGDKHMTEAEREAELERFGDRKVRRRSA